MSDDEFGDDSFLLDDSFLRQIDTLEAQARAKAAAASLPQSVSLPHASVSTSSRLVDVGNGGLQRSFTAPTAQARLAPPRPAQASSVAGPSRPRQAPPPAPSSDDYGAFDIPEEELAAIDNVTSACPGPRPPRHHLTNSNPNPPYRLNSSTSHSSSSSGRTLPSDRTRGISRAVNDRHVQTHLQWQEQRPTVGKRWDRTQYAATGRRITPPGEGDKKGKGKTKEKGKHKMATEWEEGSDMDEDEDDWGNVMAPAPKMKVDMNAPYGPQKHLPSGVTSSTYLYPTNRPRRDYQFDIVRQCFLDNTLVALPTGLGKTFVAGVVMLNYYRWFPTGKIVFLAPTRPLVNQQIEACQLTCGIPSKDTAIMTGQSVSAKERDRLWDLRRVFYCTPQTLDNDLKRDAVNPKDIVLIVFDEAHKASGHYAYTTILAYIQAHHPYFRVLALTATPGADVPRVQAVVDALHISRIEIREAEAPEISKYMNQKHTEQHVVPMSDAIADFRDRWAALMKPYIVKLIEADILTDRDLDAKRLRTYRLTKKRQEVMAARTQMWATGLLSQVEKMARAMGNLLEFSLGMFHTTMSELAGGVAATGKKSNNKGGANSIRNNFEFQKLQRDVEEEINLIRIGKAGRTGANRHPKMAKTLELLLAHFTQAEEEERTLGQKNDTRAMVFCSFRSCVIEIVDMLNEHSGLLRATKFVGQSRGKEEGDNGFNQKEQKKTINEFKDGKFNVLVSTSIGEEGLDIGEVDFVVIYDMPKQSIKLLQRIGRTGRKRDGHVHVLMSENREDMNWDTAQQTHREIQEEILHSRNLELFEDVEPLLPDGRMPECIEQEMEIDQWNPDDHLFKKIMAQIDKDTMAVVRKEAKRSARGKAKASERGKGKAKATRGNEVPDTAKGFTSVADLLRDAERVALRESSDESESEGSVRARGNGKGKAKTLAKPRGKKRARSPSPIRSESASASDNDGAGGYGGERRKQHLDKLFANPYLRELGAKMKLGQEVKGEEKEVGKGKGRGRGKEKEKAESAAKRAKPRPLSQLSSGRKPTTILDLLNDDAVLDDDDVDESAPGLDPDVQARPQNGDPPLRLRTGAGAGSPRQSGVVADGDGQAEELFFPRSSPARPQSPLQSPLFPKAASTISTRRASHPIPKATEAEPRLRELLPGQSPPRPKASPAMKGVPPKLAAERAAVISTALDFLHVEGPRRRGMTTPPSSLPHSSPPSHIPSSPPRAKPADDDVLIPSSSPLPASLPGAGATAPPSRQGEALRTKLSPRTAAAAGFSQIDPIDLSWDENEDDGDEWREAPTEHKTPAQAKMAMPPPPVPSMSKRSVISSPFDPLGASAASTPIPDTQFPVRRLRLGRRGRAVVQPSSEDDHVEAGPSRLGVIRDPDSSPMVGTGLGAGVLARGRLKRRAEPPAASFLMEGQRRPDHRQRREERQREEIPEKKRKKGPVKNFLDLDAEMSGSDSGDTSEHSASSVASEFDLEFANNFAPTQAHKGYNQQAMYLAGLGTQAQGHGLEFKRDAAKERDAFMQKARKPVLISDDEGRGRGRSSENEYELGSFVVDDEENMSFASHSDTVSGY